MFGDRFRRLGARARVPADGGPMRGTLVESDVAFGEAAAHRLDVYRPAGAARAALVVMVHGGGWRHGDKAAPRVVGNKVRHWVGHGLVVVSVNYRLLPEAGPLAQADDVARALAFVQQHGARWGADAGRIVLIGHSSGAHLVSLLTADATLAASHGVQRWSGTIALDSAAFDVERIMSRPHLPLYDWAFGADPGRWRAASPTWRLQGPLVAPMLIVSSSHRPDALEQARDFAERARVFGGRVETLAVDLAHAEANERLGLSGDYTDRIDAFMRSVGVA